MTFLGGPVWPGLLDIMIATFFRSHVFKSVLRLESTECEVGYLVGKYAFDCVDCFDTEEGWLEYLEYLA